MVSKQHARTAGAVLAARSSVARRLLQRSHVPSAGLDIARFSMLAVAVSTIGCRSSQEIPPWLQRSVAALDSRFEAISAADGIDLVEAQELANIYRSEYINGCGAALEPKLSGDLWTAGMLLGYAGKKSDRIVQVNARTGGVWSAGGPSYRDLATFHRGVLDDFVRKRR
jgi:hypothetical protein